jgi:hypothetical protein
LPISYYNFFAQHVKGEQYAVIREICTQDGALIAAEYLPNTHTRGVADILAEQLNDESWNCRNHYAVVG